MTTSGNIFQVIKETHLDEILRDHSRNLVIVMYSTKDCVFCKEIKPKFVNLSKTYTDSFFVYVDGTNMTYTNNKYFAEYTHVPVFIFYFGQTKLASIEGANEEKLIYFINLFRQKIDEKKKEMLEKEKLLQSNNTQLPNTSTDQQTQQDNNKQPENNNNKVDIFQRKVYILNRLRELAQSGVKLTKNYNLESDYDEMLLEYDLHLNPQVRQKSVEINQTQPSQIPQHIQSVQFGQPQHQNNDPQKEELIKKQNQLKQLKELDMISQKFQMNNIYKLQQLKQIQKLKEEQEKTSGKET